MMHARHPKPAMYDEVLADWIRLAKTEEPATRKRYGFAEPSRPPRYDELASLAMRYIVPRTLQTIGKHLEVTLNVIARRLESGTSQICRSEYQRRFNEQLQRMSPEEEIEYVISYLRNRIATWVLPEHTSDKPE